MLVALVVLPPPAGVELYAHVGGIGGCEGGAEGGWQVPSQSTMYSTCTKLPSYAFSLTAGVALYAHDGGSGGAEGGWQVPSQSTMYSTYTKLPSCAFSLTAGVAVVTKVYVPSGLRGSATMCAHLKRFPAATVPVGGLHLPCTTTPLAVVFTTYSSASS